MNNFMIKTFHKQRAEFESSSAVRAKMLPFPEGVTKYTDIPYADDGLTSHRMDIFRPTGRDGEDLPVIINVHGGGMILGNKEFNRQFCAQISAQGYLVCSIEYRLVPECRVYDQFADLSMAMDYIKTILPAYHGDSDHVYVVGDSGGAYLIVYTIAMRILSNPFRHVA